MLSGRKRCRCRRAVSALLAAAAIATATGGAASGLGPAPGSPRGSHVLCDLLRVVLPLECGPRAASSAAPQAAANAANSGPASQADPTQALSQRPVRASRSAIRYDPARLAVSVQPTSSPRAISALFAKAGVVVERSLPAVHAYMVQFRPGQRARALASLRASPLVRSAE